MAGYPSSNTPLLADSQPRQLSPTRRYGPLSTHKDGPLPRQLSPARPKAPLLMRRGISTPRLLSLIRQHGPTPAHLHVTPQQTRLPRSSTFSHLPCPSREFTHPSAAAPDSPAYLKLPVPAVVNRRQSPLRNGSSPLKQSSALPLVSSHTRVQSYFRVPTLHSDHASLKTSLRDYSTSNRNVMSDVTITPANSRAIPSEKLVYTFQPTAYWSGRFSTLHDYYLRDVTYSNKSRDAPAESQASSLNEALDRYSDIFRALERVCVTPEARKSLYQFRSQFARIKQLPQLDTCPSLPRAQTVAIEDTSESTQSKNAAATTESVGEPNQSQAAAGSSLNPSQGSKTVQKKSSSSKTQNTGTDRSGGRAGDPILKDNSG